METIEELNNKFLPKINTLYNNIENMNAKSAELNECIVTFDKNLSLKANKSMLYEQNEDFKKRFIDHDKFDDI